jgi:hypothetical protein
MALRNMDAALVNTTKRFTIIAKRRKSVPPGLENMSKAKARCCKEVDHIAKSQPSIRRRLKYFRKRYKYFLKRGTILPDLKRDVPAVFFKAIRRMLVVKA